MIYLLAALVTVIYALLVAILIVQWGSLKSTEEAYAKNVPVSILVPVRNEAEGIEILIQSILESTKELNHLELLIIDDHSADETVEIVRQLASKYEQLHILNLEKGQHGKKAALTYGITHARGELIICTDGDCEVGPNWVRQHIAAYQNGAKLAFGPVALKNRNKSRLTDIINLEQQALVAMGAATARIGRPSMINGCNYSFPKKIFMEVNGFKGNEHVPTGDDEFLLRKIHSIYPGQIRFLKSPAATVQTEAPGDMRQFYHQRKRWASKWRFHKDAFSKLVPAFFFIYYTVWASLLITSLYYGHYQWLALLIAKFLIDYTYLFVVTRSLEQGLSLRSFIMLQIIYPFYVVFFGLASNFGKYRWRERTYKI